MALPRRLRSVYGRASTITAWSSTWVWAKRVEAYDNWREEHLIAERMAGAKAVARDAGMQDAVALMRGYEIVINGFEKIMAIEADPEFKSTLAMKNAGDYIKLAEVVMKMKRLMFGQATENITTGPDFTENLTPEEMMSYRALVKKAGM